MDNPESRHATFNLIAAVGRWLKPTAIEKARTIKSEMKISGLMLRRSLNGTLDLIAVGFNQWQESRHAAFDFIANI